MECPPTGGAPLELAHKTDVVVFDKTGTLTQGKCSVHSVVLLLQDGASSEAPSTATRLPQSQDLAWSEARTMAMLAAVEAGSEHPLAKAMVRHATEVLAAKPLNALSSTPMAGKKATAGSEVAAPLHPAEAPAPEASSVIPAGILGQVGELEAVPGRGLKCQWTEAEAMIPSIPSSQKGKGPVKSKAAVPLVSVVVGNLQWMADNRVAVSERASAVVEALELQGCTAVIAAVAGVAIAVIGISDLVSHLAALEQA